MAQIYSSSPVVTHNQFKLAIMRRGTEVIAACAMVFVNGQPLDAVLTSRRRGTQQGDREVRGAGH
jgi:hypothetical protein